MKQTGLVLEGGGSRGVYSAGVLRYMMEQDWYLPYTIGVSAGACNGSSYVARQLDRNRQVNIDFVDHPDYLSLRNLVRKRQLFGMDFLFDTLPNELAPFDYQTFDQATEDFVVGVTDCMTGEALYYQKSDYPDDMVTLLRASSSLPLVAPVVEFEGRYLMDGGIADPIPLKQSERDGNTKHVIVLTKERGYYKKPQSFRRWIRRKYRDYPGLLEALDRRHHVYNETLDYIYEQEAKGNVFVISPSRAPEVGRVERNKEKLTALYNQGYHDVEYLASSLREFLEG
ncbi:patatin family protein [Alkalibacillus sp. S2W]|uniref:patatin-like phospholipase family protein n=1 Tax=Alkalibacillus sp. S2W TaxID=3386553 RepID=UPI00398D3FAC